MLTRTAAGVYRLGRLAGYAASQTYMYARALPAVMRLRRHYIDERFAGERSLDGCRRIAIFAHYDRRGRIHDFVIYYLSALRAAGFEIVFVSNAPRLNHETLHRLAPFCAMILRRHNLGYDFGAYKDGLSALAGLAQLDELLLVNDSVYGPLHDLSAILARCGGDAAIWGITDSWDRRYHLQSYFLLIRRPVLESPHFREFWARVRYVQSKRWVVRRYEVGFTQAMIQAGFRCSALYPHRTAAAALIAAVRSEGLLTRKDLSEDHRAYVERLYRAVQSGEPINATHFFWDFLITSLGCPFIKRELLARNPMQVPYVQQWQELIKQNSNYDTDLILRHLQASVRHRAV
jgi:lipopolysaccharide biosynthesis protein